MRSEINTILVDKYSHTDAHPYTRSFSLPRRGALVCGLLVSKIISRYLQAWSCMNALFPSFHNMMCFLFCVCFDPSLAAELCCGEARARVALLCYFWQQQWLVAVELRGDRRGGIVRPKNQRLFKGFLSGGTAV